MHDLVPSPGHMGQGRFPIRLPHIHGHRFDARPLFGAQALPKSIQALALAIKKRDELYQAFLAAQEKYNGLATRANFTLLPGQAEEMEQAQKDTERLEGELDQVIQEIQFNIPEEARKAGIPPGWLR